MDRFLFVVLPGPIEDAFTLLNDVATKAGLSLLNPGAGTATTYAPPDYDLTTYPVSEALQRVAGGRVQNVHYWADRTGETFDSFVTWKPHAYGWEFSLTLVGLNPQLVGALLSSFAELILFRYRTLYDIGPALRIEFSS